MRQVAVCILGLTLAGCASSSTIPIAQDTFQVTASAAPICGSQGAQQVAVKQAAVETIRRGYDRFIVVGGQASANVVGNTPIVVQRINLGPYLFVDVVTKPLMKAAVLFHQFCLVHFRLL